MPSSARSEVWIALTGCPELLGTVEGDQPPAVHAFRFWEGPNPPQCCGFGPCPFWGPTNRCDGVTLCANLLETPTPIEFRVEGGEAEDRAQAWAQGQSGRLENQATRTRDREAASAKRARGAHDLYPKESVRAPEARQVELRLLLRRFRAPWVPDANLWR